MTAGNELTDSIKPVSGFFHTPSLLGAGNTGRPALPLPLPPISIMCHNIVNTTGFFRRPGSSLLGFHLEGRV